MKKKQIAQLGVTLGLVAAVGVGGTLALLTAKTEAVTNTFAAGNNINATEDITLFESDQVKNNEGVYGFSVESFANKSRFNDGTQVSEWASRGPISTIDTDGVKYSDLTPNAVVTKDPRVQISANTADCYLFVKVDNGLDDVKGVSVDGIFSEKGNSHWKKLDENGDVWYYVSNEDAASNEGTVIVTDGGDNGAMYVTEPLFNKMMEAADSVDFFRTVNIPAEWKNNTADGKFTIDLTAEAIQAENVTPDRNSVGKITGWPEADIEQYTE